MGVRNGVVQASDTTGAASDASSVDNHERTTNGIGGADRNTRVALSAIALNHLRLADMRVTRHGMPTDTATDGGE